MNFIRRTVNQMLGFDWGHFNLRPGHYEMFIPTRVPPEQIWIGVEEKRHGGCGTQRSVCFCIEHKHKHGFDLIIDVTGEKCEVNWMVC